MKTISKVTKIITKIGEIIHWIGAVCMLVLAVAAASAADVLVPFFDGEAGISLSVYGFELGLTESAGAGKALVIFGIGGFFMMVCMAMIIRNVYLIVKKSENSTPFQADNVRMLKEIGIFSVVIPVIGLVMSGIIRLAVGVDAVETTVSFAGFFLALIVFCFMQFFAKGVELESDVSGLL